MQGMYRGACRSNFEFEHCLLCTSTSCVEGPKRLLPGDGREFRTPILITSGSVGSDPIWQLAAPSAPAGTTNGRQPSTPEYSTGV